MREIAIFCADIQNIRQLHGILARELQFPGWYGANLDALHDCLTSVSTDTVLIFHGFDALPFPTVGLARVLRDSETKNPHLTVSLVSI